jgi:hypothetical protein
MDLLEDDPRWRRLHARKFRCATCGGEHQGLMTWAFGRPHFWSGQPKIHPNRELRLDQSGLYEDFCIERIEGNQHFCIRCVLRLPIRGSATETFELGMWSSLSRENFLIYVESFDRPDQHRLGPWFGWLANRLAGYPDTLGLKCDVRPRDDRTRPVLELEPTRPPLGAAATRRDYLKRDSRSSSGGGSRYSSGAFGLALTAPSSAPQ